MSIRNRRAGRKSWNTRVRYESAVSEAVSQIGKLEFTYSAQTTKAMMIERHWNGRIEVITFGLAYGELSGWLGKSFANISELGFSDALVEIFNSGSTVHTPKAQYKLRRSE